MSWSVHRYESETVHYQCRLVIADSRPYNGSWGVKVVQNLYRSIWGSTTGIAEAAFEVGDCCLNFRSNIMCVTMDIAID